MGGSWSSDVKRKDLKKEYDKQFQRQIVLTDHYFVKKAALQRARDRELLFWEAVSVSILASGFLFEGLRSKNKAMIIPIAPLIMFMGYRMETASKEYLDGITNAAEKMLNDPNERKQLHFVGGRITLEELDARIARWKEQSKVTDVNVQKTLE